MAAIRHPQTNRATGNPPVRERRGASSMGRQFDVAIIGAGPAGSAAAIELARVDRRVIVIERRTFPRPKVCGGCLSGRAVERLRALARRHEPLPGTRALLITFVIGRYRLKCDPRGGTRIVLRSELDQWLAEIANEAGAEMRYGQPAEPVRGERGWDVSVDGERILAGTILLACGLSGLPRKLGIPAARARRRMIAQQWLQPPAGRMPAPGCVEMHWLRGGYVGLATPAADCCVVAMAAEVPDTAGENVWECLRRLNPDAPIWSSVPADAPRRYSAKGAAGFPWAPRRLGVDNVLLIGDAAGYEEPFTGEGMAQAMGSATCAAQAILQGGDILRNYSALMERNHRPSAGRLRLLGRILRNPLVGVLAAGPVLLPQRPLARLIERVHVEVPK